MSQYDANAGGMSDFGHGGPRPTNVLGIVGFILAFCTGPIGLIISLIALAKPPRGFAIGGVVVGLIWTIAAAVMGLGAWAARDMIGMTIQTTAQYTIITAEIESYKNANNGALPADLSALNIPADMREDFWGTEWRLEISADGTSYTLVSAGIDRVFGTEDDIRLAPGLSQQQLSRALQDVGTRMMMGEQGGGSGTTRGALPAPNEDDGAEDSNGQ